MKVLFITQTDELGSASRYMFYQYLTGLAQSYTNYKVQR